MYFSFSPVRNEAFQECTAYACAHKSIQAAAERIVSTFFNGEFYCLPPFSFFPALFQIGYKTDTVQEVQNAFLHRPPESAFWTL